MINGKLIRQYRDSVGRKNYVFEDDNGGLSTVTELSEEDISFYKKLKQGEMNEDEMSKLWS